ncbi:hypothetical protein [Bradyrhizobium australafricanum]|uniref:hypothetical protein n=1 Tax=Bradyrhizobium australafricanum TaxID=2821406 RepID=UPI0035E13934
MTPLIVKQNLYSVKIATYKAAWQESPKKTRRLARHGLRPAGLHGLRQLVRPNGAAPMTRRITMAICMRRY